MQPPSLADLYLQQYGLTGLFPSHKLLSQQVHEYCQLACAAQRNVQEATDTEGSWSDLIRARNTHVKKLQAALNQWQHASMVAYLLQQPQPVTVHTSAQTTKLYHLLTFDDAKPTRLLCRAANEDEARTKLLLAVLGSSKQAVADFTGPYCTPRKDFASIYVEPDEKTMHTMFTTLFHLSTTEATTLVHDINFLNTYATRIQFLLPGLLLVATLETMTEDVCFISCLSG